MPFIGRSPLSYIAVADDLVAHWTRVNTASPDKPIVCKGNYAVASLTVERNALGSKVSEVRVHRTARETAASVRDGKKEAVRGYLTRFRGAVTSVLMDTPYVKNLPLMPGTTGDEQRFKEPFLKMAEQWRTINGLGSTVPGFTAPLIIGDDITLDAYEDALAELESSYRSIDVLDNNLDTSRSERDSLLPNIRKRAQQYKAALIARYGNDHAFVKSIPTLSTSPGSTPSAVKLSATWDTERELAVFTWSASSLPEVHYALRTTGSLPYKIEDEEAVVTVTTGNLTAATDAGLQAPGAEANFKVYVVTKDGNERGSNTVKVKRPVE